jgi:3-oxoacyl-[acyl-carrier-protein] synthase II
MKRRVVVTGLGVVTPLSCKVEDLFRRLLAGEAGIHALQAFDTATHKVTIGGDIHDWSSQEYIPPKEAKRLDRFTEFAMVAAVDAIDDSGIDFSAEDMFRCGVILGSGIGGLITIEEQHARLIRKGVDRVSALTVPRMMLNAAGGNVAIKYGLQGINYSVATACASATNAIGDALKAIQYGDADVIVTGGAEAAITEMGMAAFANMRALSQRNDEPASASRPFDMDRDGFVLSEGAGLLVVEELEHARARGAKIYGELLGFGAGCDAGHITSPDAQGRGAAHAMDAALKNSGLEPEAIDYINAHGTGTQLGDKAETLAVKAVFGESARRVSLSSTKSQLGHSLGASGGIELVVAIQAMNQSVIPPTINLDTPDPDCDLDYTPNEPRERTLRAVMSNSFGFGGHNASVIVGPLQ